MLRLERWLVSQVPELYVFSQICIVTLMSAQLSLAAKPSDGPFFLTKRFPPSFPASRYAELVSGGHLPTISGAHISAPAGPCILRQQNMERQVGRQG